MQICKPSYLFIILFFFIRNLYAQDAFSGKVSDNNNNPLQGATIILKTVDSLAGATLTDKKGIFKIEGLAHGEYQFSISYIGYQPVNKKITLNKNEYIEYILEEAAAIHLNEVVVSADRSNIVTMTSNGSAFHLSEFAKKSKDIYEALKEIPKLTVDNTNKSITLNDGSKPLILINGIQREGKINTIDPKDIESVEVIEVPSARYLTEGITSIVNLKVKRQQQPYQFMNIGAKHNPGLIFGITDASYEKGNENYSLYLTGQQFYLYKNKSSGEEYQKSATVIKEMNTDRSANYSSYSVAGGGDRVISSEDYLAYSITYNNIPESYKINGEGTILDESLSDSPLTYTYLKNYKKTFFVNTYNLYHKHTFSNKSVLETSLRANLNGSSNKGDQKEDGDDYNFRNKFDFRNKRYSGTFAVNYEFSMLKQHDINIGSQTDFQKNIIDQRLTLLPAFHHREWDEYFYVDFSKTWNQRFSYMVSLGLNMIFNKSAETHNSYHNLKSSMSLGYKINNKNTARFSYSGYTVAPSVVSLNPYNTSTDTLFVSIGNPYLEPYRVNNFRLSYVYNHNGIYLEPNFTYQTVDDYITNEGEQNGNIYTQKPVNRGKQQQLGTNITARYNIRNAGYISMNAGYRRLFFEDAKDRNLFEGNFNFNFYYKRFSISGYCDMHIYDYDRINKTKSTPESEFTLSWNINKKWVLNLGSRYVISRAKYEKWIDDGEYHSYYLNRFKDRKFVCLIGFRYNWHNNAATSNRQKKKLYQEEKGIQLIKE